MKYISRQRFPYHKIEADPVRQTVVFRTGETVFTIEELIAQMLQKGKEFAEDFIGELKKLTRNIIYVQIMYIYVFNFQ